MYNSKPYCLAAQQYTVASPENRLLEWRAKYNKIVKADPQYILCLSNDSKVSLKVIYFPTCRLSARASVPYLWRDPFDFKKIYNKSLFNYKSYITDIGSFELIVREFESHIHDNESSVSLYINLFNSADVDLIVSFDI
ncbi:23088_t:CDS:2 [Gigaspora margarita]|uniref:23088_t:CDS:1 n=1 Tax=Gigaspora margarita TaxID=4874 RepID=A0ABM8VVK3_GIGMA|nr:23088_t:CDS:2 [Gigaspora margarita]